LSCGKSVERIVYCFLDYKTPVSLWATPLNSGVAVGCCRTLQEDTAGFFWVAFCRRWGKTLEIIVSSTAMSAVRHMGIF